MPAFAADAIDKWVDDLAHYEETMEAMAKASLDQNFKDELNAIEQWFQVLSDPERTATLYSLLQHTNRVQQGFFIAVLQQMNRKDNRASNEKAKEAKKAADAGRQRRLSSKPQLAIAGTNEKYAQLYGAPEDSSSVTTPSRTPLTAQSYKQINQKPGTTSAYITSRPRSAATTTGMFPNGDKQYTPGVAGADKVIRPYSVMDQSAFEDNSISSVLTQQGGAATPSNGEQPKGAKWQPMTPTFGNFSEVAKGIERPQSTNDLDRNALINARLSNKMASAVRSPLGPGGGDSGFLARAQSRGISTMANPKMSATPPLSAGLRALHSPAFPPGLFPTNPWATGTNPSGGDKKNSSAALKQKFANLIADSRADASKDAAAAAAAKAALLANGGAGGEPKSPKPVEPIDFKLLQDIPAWFRSMRLHKYTPLFETMKWQEIILMDDEKLNDKGVAALGARRKMLKVFEQVKLEAVQKGVSTELA